MKNKISILCVICMYLCKVTISNAQSKNDYISSSYHINIMKGEIAYLNKEYKECIKHYKRAFRKNKPLNMAPYYEIDKITEIYAILKKRKKVKKYLIWQLKNGEIVNKFKEDSTYSLPKRDWKKIDKKYVILRSNYLKKINDSLRREVENICVTDQLYRKGRMSQDIWVLQSRIDSLNFIKLRRIFETYGFPNNNLIGNHTVRTLAGNDILTVIRHATIDDLRNYFIPKLEYFVRKGYCHPEEYAGILDYYQLRQGGIPIYGTIINYDLKKYKLESNVKRAEIGLCNIELSEERDKLIKKKYNLPD